VAYFDSFERVVLAADLKRPVYPKDPNAPICACFGLTRAEIEQDVREGAVTRTKAVLARAKCPEARCTQMAANGRPCVAFVQKYYMRCRAEMGS
jgi:NAD(P)H-nitrite reductase large subunit